MTTLRKAFIAAVMLVAPSIVFVAVAEAQSPIRIGASASKTGTYAAGGQNQLRGYQLCVRRIVASRPVASCSTADSTR